MSSQGSPFLVRPAPSGAIRCAWSSRSPTRLRGRRAGRGRQWALLAEQIERHRPRLVSVQDEEGAESCWRELRARAVAGPGVGVGGGGPERGRDARGAEIVIGAWSGRSASCRPTRALEAGRRVALANKETLVIAGETDDARRRALAGAELLPVDSEHNALHQCLRGERRGEVRRLILTASGGPSASARRGDASATASEALTIRPGAWATRSRSTRRR